MRIPRQIILLSLILVSACGTPQPTPTLSPTAVPFTPTETPTIPPSSTPTEAFTSTNTSTPTLGIGSTWISPLDGMVMVFVPAGPFQMGYTGGYADELPVHTVTLDAFWIDKTEVTIGLYDLCVQAGACQPPRRRTSNAIDDYYGNPKYADYPVINVSWIDAQSYCTWAGRRLPSEAEWEKAARGTDGRLHPWGNNAPEKNLASFGNNIEDISKTGSYPDGASPYGVLDMAGNVWEWTADWYGQDYYSQSPDRNPPGPESGTKRVLRGGSWHYDASGIRSTYRLAKDPTFSSYEIGIRCVRIAP